jgi:hypothetical protein
MFSFGLPVEAVGCFKSGVYFACKKAGESPKRIGCMVVGKMKAYVFAASLLRCGSRGCKNEKYQQFVLHKAEFIKAIR